MVRYEDERPRGIDQKNGCISFVGIGLLSLGIMIMWILTLVFGNNMRCKHRLDLVVSSVLCLHTVSFISVPISMLFRLPVWFDKILAQVWITTYCLGNITYIGGIGLLVQAENHCPEELGILKTMYYICVIMGSLMALGSFTLVADQLKIVLKGAFIKMKTERKNIKCQEVFHKIKGLPELEASKIYKEEISNIAREGIDAGDYRLFLFFRLKVTRWKARGQASENNCFKCAEKIHKGESFLQTGCCQKLVHWTCFRSSVSVDLRCASCKNRDEPFK